MSRLPAASPPFLATFEARTWRSSPSVGRVMVFRDFLDFLEFMEASEVAGPGPNSREIEISFGADGPLACVRGPWATLSRVRRASVMRGGMERPVWCFHPQGLGLSLIHI